MAERLNAPVLKTGDCNRSVSSNLTSSAKSIGISRLCDNITALLPKSLPKSSYGGFLLVRMIFYELIAVGRVEELKILVLVVRFSHGSTLVSELKVNELTDRA